MDDLESILPRDVRRLVKKAMRAAYARGVSVGRDETLAPLRVLSRLNGSGEALLKAFDESKHPRDHGKFSSGGGGGAAVADAPEPDEPDTPEEHDGAGEGPPPDEHVLAGLEEHVPAGVWHAVRAKALAATARVYEILAKASPAAMKFLEAVFDTPADFQKFGYAPTVAGVGAGTSDPLRAATGVGTYAAVNVAAEVLSRVAAWVVAKGKPKVVTGKLMTTFKAVEGDATDEAAGLLAECLRALADEFGLSDPPDADGIAGLLRKPKYSSTQVMLTGPAADLLRDLNRQVRDEDLGEDGREDEPHVTVRYGLHTSDPDEAARVLAGFGPARMTFGRPDVFRGADAGKDYDVLVLPVDSPDLHAMNRALASLPHTDTFPEYKPHATIAYVKAGLGDGYVESLGYPRTAVREVAGSVVFSDRMRNHTVIPLDDEGGPDRGRAVAEAILRHAEESLDAGEDPTPGIEALRQFFGDADTVEKAWTAEDHPRDKGGRFISKDRLTDAKSDPKLAAKLRQEVKPEDAGKLEAVLTGDKDPGRTKRGQAKHEAGVRRNTREEAKAKTEQLLDKLKRSGDLKYEVTADDLHALADHVPHMTVAEIRRARAAMQGGLARKVGFGGASRREGLVGALVAHARAAGFEARLAEQGITGAEADEMRRAAGFPDTRTTAERIEQELSASQQAEVASGGVAPAGADAGDGREPTLAELETGVRPGGGPRAQYGDPMSKPYRRGEGEPDTRPGWDAPASGPGAPPAEPEPTQAPTAAPAGPKEPWQMTAREWETEWDAVRGQGMGGGAGKVPKRALSSRGVHSAIDRHRELKMGLPDIVDPDGIMPPRGARHRDVIEHALAAGKPVPPEVLADYPDLRPADAPTPEPAPAPAPTPEPAKKKPAARKPKSTGSPGVDAALAEYHAATSPKVKDHLEAELWNLGVEDPSKPVKVKATRRAVARRLASAYAQLHEKGATPDELAHVERAMEAHGMRRLGTPGERLTFDGRYHEGPAGLFPGDSATVGRSGWALDDNGVEYVPLKASASAGGGGGGNSPPNPSIGIDKPASVGDTTPVKSPAVGGDENGGRAMKTEYRENEPRPEPPVGQQWVRHVVEVPSPDGPGGTREYRAVYRLGPTAGAISDRRAAATAEAERRKQVHAVITAAAGTPLSERPKETYRRNFSQIPGLPAGWEVHTGNHYHGGKPEAIDGRHYVSYRHPNSNAEPTYYSPMSAEEYQRLVTAGNAPVEPAAPAGGSTGGGTVSHPYFERLKTDAAPLVERAKRTANGIRGRYGLPAVEHELALVPLDSVSPVQTGEDYDNESSRALAKHIAKLDSSGRSADYMPAIIDEQGRILDGNHRHAAHKIAGLTHIPVLRPKPGATNAPQN